MSSSSFFAVWEFQVKPDSISSFEEIYGPDGDWARLFRRSVEYRGTELLRDPDRLGRYLTIDRWTSREALQTFKQDHHAEYSALDQQCESLTETEIQLGDFFAVGALRKPPLE